MGMGKGLGDFDDTEMAWPEADDDDTEMAWGAEDDDTEMGRGAMGCWYTALG